MQDEPISNLNDGKYLPRVRVSRVLVSVSSSVHQRIT